MGAAALTEFDSSPAIGIWAVWGVLFGNSNLFYFYTETEIARWIWMHRSSIIDLYCHSQLFLCWEFPLYSVAQLYYSILYFTVIPQQPQTVPLTVMSYSWTVWDGYIRWVRDASLVRRLRQPTVGLSSASRRCVMMTRWWVTRPSLDVSPRRSYAARSMSILTVLHTVPRKTSDVTVCGDRGDTRAIAVPG